MKYVRPANWAFIIFIIGFLATPILVILIPYISAISVLIMGIIAWAFITIGGIANMFTTSRNVYDCNWEDDER
jgi:hypothetical protein